jgi:RimJ/RimL family protein N-acetyltransferase
MEYTTKDLHIRPFLPGDREAMAALLMDKIVAKTYMLPDFDHPKQAEALFEKLMRFSRSDDHFEYGIYFKQTLIGFVNECEITDTTIELGYVIEPAYQGKGFATEAVRACIDELFRMGFRQVKAGYFQENLASCRVMQKCGMQKIDYTEDIDYRGKINHCIFYEKRV